MSEDEMNQKIMKGWMRSIKKFYPIEGSCPSDATVYYFGSINWDPSPTIVHKCPPHIYDNAKVVVRDGQLKTLSKCAYCGFELIF